MIRKCSQSQPLPTRASEAAADVLMPLLCWLCASTFSNVIWNGQHNSRGMEKKPMSTTTTLRTFQERNAATDCAICLSPSSAERRLACGHSLCPLCLRALIGERAKAMRCCVLCLLCLQPLSSSEVAACESTEPLASLERTVLPSGHF